MAFGKKDSKGKSAPSKDDAKSRMAQVDDEVVEGFETEADAYELPPPVDDGEHIIELKLSENKSEPGTFEVKDEEGNVRTHAFLQLVLTIVGKSDPQKGRVIFDTPNTMPRKTAKGTTTAVATLVRLCGGKPTGKPWTDTQTLKSILSKSTPKFKVVTQWRAQYDKEQIDTNTGKRLKDYKKGQGNFPQVDGKPVPLFMDNEKRPVRTNATVVSYSKVDAV